MTFACNEGWGWVLIRKRWRPRATAGRTRHERRPDVAVQINVEVSFELY